MINSRVPRGKKYVINMLEFNYDTYPLLYPHPHLSFTPEEERIGQQKLREFGIPKGAPFICFHARDPAYLEGRKKDGYHVTQDWYYATYRDVNIKNLLPAAEELTKKGYYLIRMGAAVAEPLKTNNPKIIDYATKYRTDFMDIYLGAKCTFFLIGESGIATIPMIFRRPVAFDNVIPFGHAQVCQDNYLYIPKKLWLTKENRQMTISEIFESGVAWFEFRELYDAMGIEIIENTADEIKSLAIEMEARLKGTWIAQNEDEKLQTEFWALFNPEGPYHKDVHKIVNARVGAEYLRQNREILK
jgi:putative glycosyltransferase (TIGR04372 family)